MFNKKTIDEIEISEEELDNWLKEKEEEIIIEETIEKTIEEKIEEKIEEIIEEITLIRKQLLNSLIDEDKKRKLEDEKRLLYVKKQEYLNEIMYKRRELNDLNLNIKFIDIHTNDNFKEYLILDDKNKKVLNLHNIFLAMNSNNKNILESIKNSDEDILKIFLFGNKNLINNEYEELLKDETTFNYLIQVLDSEFANNYIKYIIKNDNCLNSLIEIFKNVNSNIYYEKKTIEYEIKYEKEINIISLINDERTFNNLILIDYDYDYLSSVDKIRIKQVDEYIKYLIAINPYCSKEIFNYLVNDSNLLVKKGLAINNNTPVEVLKTLIKSPINNEIKELISLNKNASNDILKILENECDDSILKNIIKHKNYSNNNISKNIEIEFKNKPLNKRKKNNTFKYSIITFISIMIFSYSYYF